MTKRRIVAKSHFTAPASKSKVTVRGKVVKSNVKPKPKPQVIQRAPAKPKESKRSKGWNKRVISLDYTKQRQLCLPQVCQCNGSCNPYRDAEDGTPKCLSCGKQIVLSLPPILRPRKANRDDIRRWREEEDLDA